ncbi:MAG: hypothetical protein VYE77_09550 [Planctomycetota bacterium]|nr:hypothetical protein [Planctomycetota bacterium]
MNQHDPRDRFLTDADLEQLDIPAERVDAWLHEGSLEQLDLPHSGADAGPVYVVHSTELTEILEQGLQTLGRSHVILDPDQARTEMELLLEEQGAFADASHEPPTGAAPTLVHEVAGSLTSSDKGSQWCDLPNLADDDLFRHVTAEDSVSPTSEDLDANDFDTDLVEDAVDASGEVEAPTDLLSDVQDALDCLLSNDGQQQTQLASLMADPADEAPAPTDQSFASADLSPEPFDGSGDEADHTMFREGAPEGRDAPSVQSVGFDFETLAEPLRQIDLTVRMLAEQSANQPGLAQVIETLENGFASLLDALPQVASLQSIDNQLQELRVSVNRLAASPRQVAQPATPRVARRSSRQGSTRSRAPSKSDATLRKMSAATLMLMGWVGLLWSHTIGTKFAAVTFVAANVLGCLLLTMRSDRRS